MLLYYLVIVLLVPGELLAEERQREGTPGHVEKPLLSTSRHRRHHDLQSTRQQRLLTIRSPSTVTLNDHVKEVCQLETFEPVCPPDNVMLIQQADYGRMAVGRCINRNYYIGCSANVLEQVNKRCSLRKSCRISVPDHSLLRNSACPKDLVAFLSVKYACIKVQDTLTFQCSHKGQTVLHLEPVAYVTGRDLNHVRSSGIPCKIIVSAKPGQIIRVTLHELWSRDAAASGGHWLRSRKRRRSSAPLEDNFTGHGNVGHWQKPIRINALRSGGLEHRPVSSHYNSTATSTSKSLASPTSIVSVATKLQRTVRSDAGYKIKRSNHVESPVEDQVKVQPCIPVALIAEATNPDQKHPVCRGGLRLPRHTVVYTSSGSSLQLTFSLDAPDQRTGSDDGASRKDFKEAIEGDVDDEDDDIGGGNGDDDDDDDDGGFQVTRFGDFLMSFQAHRCPDLEMTLGAGLKVTRKGDQAEVVCPSSHEVWSLSCVNDTWIGELGRCDEERSFAGTFENFEFHWRSAYGGWFVATVCIALGGVLSVGLIGVVISQRRRNCYKLFPPKSSSSSSSSAHHLKQQRHQRKLGQGTIKRGDLIHCNLIGCPLDQPRVEPDHGNDLHLCTDPLFCTNDSLFCHPDPVFCDLRRSHESEVKFCDDCQKRLSEQNVNKLSPSCRVCRFPCDLQTTD